MSVSALLNVNEMLILSINALKKSSQCRKTIRFNPSDLRDVMNIQTGLGEQTIHNPPSKHA